MLIKKFFVLAFPVCEIIMKFSLHVAMKIILKRTNVSSHFHDASTDYPNRDQVRVFQLINQNMLALILRRVVYVRQ